MHLNIKTANVNQGESVGPNPNFGKLEFVKEVPRLNSIHEIAIEYVHDLRRANDVLGRMAFQPRAEDDPLLKQIEVVRAKNTELEARNADLSTANKNLQRRLNDWETKHPWDRDVHPAPGNPLGFPANYFLKHLAELVETQRKEITGLREANKQFADAAVKPEPETKTAPPPKAGPFKDAIRDIITKITDDGGPSPHPDGDCDQCGVTDCDFNPKFVGSSVAGEETYPGDPKPAEAKLDDILAKMEALGEQAVKEAREAMHKAEKAATDPGPVPVSALEAAAAKHPMEHLKPETAAYYKAPEGVIDGDKAIREGRANLDAYVSGTVNPRAG